MYNGGKILVGLIIFVAFFTLPFYYNLGKVNAKPEPKIDTPVIQSLPVAEKHCVESRDFMRAEHMQLLNKWRDTAVRDDNRIFEGMNGTKYYISLQNTCMRCHSNKKEFCDKCHNYMGVRPYCWDCHIAPKEKES
jgi:[DsrC]-trisulfide reductase subunit J